MTSLPETPTTLTPEQGYEAAFRFVAPRRTPNGPTILPPGPTGSDVSNTLCPASLCPRYQPPTVRQPDCP